MGLGRLATALVVLCVSAVATAEPLAPAAPGMLRVGASNTPPFAISGGDGSASGIAIDLWTVIARELGRSFTVDIREPGELLQGLQDGSLDVVIGPVAITPEHAAVADLTRAYFATTLAIAVRPEPTLSWTRILSTVFSPRLLHVLLSMALTALVLGGLVWLLERHGVDGHFEPHARRGVWSAVWWAASTLTTVGYGDKTPRTVAGQAIAMAGMILGILLVSVLAATFASEITLNHLRSVVSSPSDLRRVAVGTVGGSTAEHWLEAHTIPSHPYLSVGEALDALERRQVDAVVHYDAVLRYWANSTLRGELTVLPVVLEPEFLGFALPKGSPLLAPVDQALLRAIDSDAWTRVVRSHLGEP